jgi:hypothetical protein
MENNITLSPKAEAALHRLQDTKLTPMEEALFQGWTKANKIEDPDNPEDVIDYRGIWKSTNGLVVPGGELARSAEMKNNMITLEKELQQRMLDRVSELTGKQEDFQTKMFDAQRKDVDHKQSMEQGQLELQKAPYDLQMRDRDIKGKELDLQKQSMGLDSQRLGNEGKELDLVSALMTPEREVSTTSDAPTPKE